MSIMLNEDNSHFFGSRGKGGRKITREDIIDWVMQYVNSNVETLLISPNSMKTSYRSEVWDSIWDHIEGSEVPGANAWIDGSKQLHEDGIDVYKVMTDTCRENNLECYLSMRMNDAHGVPNFDSHMHSKFWKDHHDYWRVKHKFDNWFCRQFDYSIDEVREYHFLLVEELFERYDFDGFELDWLRFPLHLKQGYGLEGQEQITGFMRRVRKLANEYEIKRGHKIKIAARIPSRPRTAFETGMDFMTWAREGLVDILVPAPFFASIDNDIPVELWKNILKDAKVELAVGLELLLYNKGGVRKNNTLETLRGTFASYLNRGADHIYMFNYFDKYVSIFAMHEAIKSSDMTIDELNKGSRRHVITNVDVTAPGAAGEEIIPRTFGGWETFRINIGPIPPQDKKVYLVLGTEEEILKEDEIYFNGTKIEVEDIKFEFEIVGKQYVFSINNDLLKEGYNIFDINPKDKMCLLWGEIYIK